jgi:hypothetical protein
MDPKEARSPAVAAISKWYGSGMQNARAQGRLMCEARSVSPMPAFSEKDTSLALSIMGGHLPQ